APKINAYEPARRAKCNVLWSIVWWQFRHRYTFAIARSGPKTDNIPLTPQTAPPPPPLQYPPAQKHNQSISPPRSTALALSTASGTPGSHRRHWDWSAMSARTRHRTYPHDRATSHPAPRSYRTD